MGRYSCAHREVDVVDRDRLDCGEMAGGPPRGRRGAGRAGYGGPLRTCAAAVRLQHLLSLRSAGVGFVAARAHCRRRAQALEAVARRAVPGADADSGRTPMTRTVVFSSAWCRLIAE